MVIYSDLEYARHTFQKEQSLGLQSLLLLTQWQVGWSQEIPSSTTTQFAIGMTWPLARTKVITDSVEGHMLSLFFITQARGS